MSKPHKHLFQLRTINLKRLHVLELQAAQFGINTPPHILLEIEDIKEKVLHLDSQLKNSLASNENFQKTNSSQITVNGNVSGTIIIGNQNEIQSLEKKE